MHICIDDFGTGYCSLSCLKRLPVETIKIDRSFVSKLPRDRASASIISAVTELATVLRLTVIAEGVETPSQLAALRRCGVRYAQGYLFGRPTSDGLRAAPITLPA